MIFCVFGLGLVLSFSFFFSSRRRHTRCLSDWSSDVCSSDLSAGSYGFMEASRLAAGMEATAKDWVAWPGDPEVERGPITRWRSEERRVGKECRSGWSA